MTTVDDIVRAAPFRTYGVENALSDWGQTRTIAVRMGLIASCEHDCTGDPMGWHWFDRLTPKGQRYRAELRVRDLAAIGVYELSA